MDNNKDKNQQSDNKIAQAINELDNMRPRSFTGRLKEVKTSRWIRFAVVSVIFFLWVIWMGNPWLLLLWILLADIYITSYVPWTFWKKTTKGFTRVVMGWIDAIVYALVLVYFIFAFVGQNYTIPSSSLEKSLLIGDFLWVNKMVYGPRVPNTLLHFPLAQHTMPVVGGKSYFENPQLEYHRLPGLRSVERGDIVVFNYPQGDTVTLGPQMAADYYRLCHALRAEGIENPQKFIAENPGKFGKVIVRPVDRRENYVKRAVGLPGDRLKIAGDVIYINGKPIKDADKVQFNYIVPVSRPITREQWEEAGVSARDSGDMPMENEIDGRKFYRVPLTAETLKTVSAFPQVSGKIVRETSMETIGIVGGIFPTGDVFPLGNEYGWTRTDMGEFWIPKRGSTLRLTLENLPVYERAIRTYEGNDLQVRDGKIYINGKQTDYYTFKMDYYWMMGDNRDMSDDSRYWGFVPEDHIVGTPMLLLFSVDEEKSWTDLDKIRWDRVLRNPNPDKSKW